MTPRQLELVNRLRDIANHPFDVEPLDTSIECSDAADEIVRLMEVIGVYDIELQKQTWRLE